MTKKGLIIIAVVVLCVLSLVFLIAGIVLFVQASKKSQESCKAADDSCAYSEEAKSVGLNKILQKVQDAFYETYPEQYYAKPGFDMKELKSKYKPFDPSPAKIKERTDTAQKLLAELENTKINVDKLKQREKKALSQSKFFLKFIFSSPYEGNYYNGDWMLGPDLFCYRPICYVGSEMANNLHYFKPKTVSDFEKFRDILIQLNGTFARYIENLKLGVQAGMVGPEETCNAGLQSLSVYAYPNVFRKGEQGIFDESYVREILKPEFLADIQGDSGQLTLWRQKYKQSVNESLREFVLVHLGRPIDNVLRYLRGEYKSHCVPSSISSGLSTLPLPYVYTNGTPDKTETTTKTLPTGERLSGSKAYESIMAFFTTNDMTPTEVYNIGVETLNTLYPQALKIASQITNQTNETLAKEMFIQQINETDMFYMDGQIPKNESGKEAKKLCISEETAKKHCPTRWKAINLWFKEAREIMSKLDATIVNMFYFTGKKKTTPSCPVKMKPDFNPESGAQSYMPSDAQCSSAASYLIPFFLQRLGPKYEEYSVNAHEVMPGHHLQVQGNAENFGDPCGGLVGWVQSATGQSYTAFVEGWGLYAENPLIAEETNVYGDKPLNKYGMLKWQIWRALRLIVDTGLHYRNMTRAQAIKKFKDYTWTTGDVVEKEVTRYQSNPGQATSYMIGQRHLIKLRAYAKKELGSKFNLKDFHYQILSQGTAPLKFLESHIEKYVSCVKTPTKDCSFVEGSSQPKSSFLDASQRAPDRRDATNYRAIRTPIRRYQ